MISNDERFRFDISPEPRYANVNVSEGNFVDVVFTVQNRSHRAVRVEAIVNALTGPNDSRGEPLPTEIWSDWFTVLGAQELYFDNTSVKHITVRITLPNRLLYGMYKFQLLIVGVDDPDEELAESDTVAVKVSGSGINVGRFVVIALLILAVIILLAVGAALIFQPRPRLDVNLAAPLNATPGKVANYTVTIKNARQSDATNVALHYKLPEGVIGATAFVPNAAFRYCEEDVRDIHCNLGTLKADETKIVQIDFIPGPFPTYPATITNTETVTVTSSLDDQSASTPAAVKIQTTEILTPTELSVAIDPSVATAVLDEPVTYNVMAWNNITDTDVLTLTYHLPAKMHYEDPIPKRCELLDDYFTMICVSDKLNYNSANPDIASFVIKAIPADTATAFTSKVTDVEYVTSEGVKPDFDGEDSTNLETLGAKVDTRTVNSALQFNGIDDWAELGYQKAPENFTVEMWVHPVSTNDGQSFIGAHKLDEFEEDVQNVFLAGYWEDGLHINLNGESHTLADMKMTDRFHLAVVVKKRDNDSSEVTVYVDGRLVNDWVDGNEDDSLCDGCIIFEETLDGSQTLPWVLGQDWDQGSQGPIPSDFFHGSLNDVRIWETALGQDEIQRYMQLRPPVDSPGLVANWRLEPVTPDSPVLVDRINTANNGTRKGHVGWGEPVTRFGSALVFDGLSDLLFYTPPQEPLAENNGETAVEELDDAA
ncbi:MAG: hypothetical protein KDE48_01650, partial [Anaerolineales bacterium]|nr:hypothetical protein [Anaerolineales bacterium]